MLSTRSWKSLAVLLATALAVGETGPARTFDEVRLDDWDSAEMVSDAEEQAVDAELGVRPGQLRWLDRLFSREPVGAELQGGAAWPHTLYAEGEELLYGAVVPGNTQAWQTARKGKRSGEQLRAEYDYEQLRAEYEEAARDSTVPPPGGGLPLNCSAEAARNYGPQALRCLWREMKAASTRPQRLRLATRLGRVFVFWLAVYVVVAIPFWCHKGWCCCCLHPCFAFCRPRSNLRNVRSYLARNPPGKMHAPDGLVINYQPSVYETELFHAMERQVRRMLEV